MSANKDVWAEPKDADEDEEVHTHPREILVKFGMRSTAC